MNNNLNTIQTIYLSNELHYYDTSSTNEMRIRKKMRLNMWEFKENIYHIIESYHQHQTTTINVNIPDSKYSI
mgnify:CR=1 FL=1